MHGFIGDFRLAELIHHLIGKSELLLPFCLIEPSQVRSDVGISLHNERQHEHRNV